MLRGGVQKRRDGVAKQAATCELDARAISTRFYTGVRLRAPKKSLALTHHPYFAAVCAFDFEPWRIRCSSSTRCSAHCAASELIWCFRFCSRDGW